MISLAQYKKIYLSVNFVDFRMGIDGLKDICKVKLKKNPFSGSVFLFINRRKNSIKILIYDGQGFWLMQKRLSAGVFKWWPSSVEDIYSMNIYQLQIFLRNGDPSTVKVSDDWKKIA